MPGTGEAEASPLTPSTAARSPELLTVGAPVEFTVQQEAIHALASAKRAVGDSLLADLAVTILQNARQSQAQLFQDVFALFFAESGRNGFFVEVGTGDGKLISNTYMLEKEWGWNGVVVEPNSAFWPALKKHRSCQIATDCLFDITGRTVKFMCAEAPEFSGISRNVADFHQDARKQNSVEVTMTTLSLNDLFEREGVPDSIDYLSIDVEGAEFDILQTFNFDKYQVGCLTIEHNWTQKRDSVFNLMLANGYVRVFEHLSQWDDWYVSRDVLKRFPAASEYLSTIDDEISVPPSAARFVAWSLEAIARNEPEVAEALCQRALELEPNCCAAYRTLADVAISQGRRTLALQHWRAAVEADPKDFWARIGLSELLAARGAISEAVSHLRVATKLDADVKRANDMLSELLPKAAGQLDVPAQE